MPSDRKSPVRRPISRLTPASTAGSGRIVIAEPDADTRSWYREALGGLAMDIVEADDGRDALVHCLARKPALVVAELRLPMIDGYALCELLRRDALTHAVPMLVVTTDSRPPERLRAHQAGATSILGKPVSVDLFVAEAARLYGASHEEAQSAKIEPAPPDESTVATTRRSASRAFRRFETTSPPREPRLLHCPSCGRVLEYRKSRIGGVSRAEAEQWDELRCPDLCGGFEYRHRTGTLRLIS